MKVGSLFSGIGGFDLGLERAGMEVTGFAEIDSFGSKVLAHHWPGVPNHGDVRGVGGCPSADDGRRQAGAGLSSGVDLICGGFPCQDLSVAGKRAGLDGARSGLWFEFHRILSELRPSVALIENVPGLLSSNSGRDFGIILRGLDDIWPGRWGWAVLDSQHFGVAQRRRRLYVIAGPRRERIAQILSLCEGGDWHSPKSREAREDVASTIRGSSSSPGVNEPGRGGEDDVNLILAPTLDTHLGDKQWLEDQSVGNFLPVMQAIEEQRLTHSLRAEGFDASEDGTGRGTPLVAIRTANTGANGHGLAEEVAHTLDRANGQAIAGAAVRRLTPTECERLQGFPDGWTRLDDKTPDGPRYKALGNAVTVPVIEYLGRRMMEVL